MDLFDLVAKLTLDTSEYESGLDQAESNGKGMGNKLKGAFGTAMKAGAGLAAGAVAAGAAIYGMATKSAQTSDRIDKMSQKMGLSREAFQELDFVASQSGTSVESMRGGMKTLTSQMTAATKGTGDAAKMFEQLGISVTDSSGNMKDQETMLFETISALQNMEDGTEKAAIANKLLGKSGQELMPLLNSEAGSLDDMRQQAHDLGLVLSDETIDAGVKFTDTVDQVKRSLSAIGTQIGAEVMPIVQTALEFVLQHMPEIQAVVSTVFGVLSKVVTTAVNIIKNVLLPALDSVIKFVKGVFSGDWKSAWEAVKGVFSNVWNGISKWFSDLFSKAKDMIAKIDWGGMASKIWETIKNAFKAAVNWFATRFTAAKDAIKNLDWGAMALAVWNFIMNAFANAVSWFRTRFNNVKEAIKNIDWGAMATAVWNFIKNAFTSAVSWFKEKFTSVKSAISNIDWAGLGKSMWNHVKNAFSSVGSWFKEKFNDAKSAVANISWSGLGSSIWNGVKSGLSGIKEWFKGLFNLSGWHIPMPHVSVSTTSGPFGIKIPSFSVRWYKRAYEQALMFMQPTVIPSMYGYKGFGDGVGSEIVMSDRKLREIAGSADIADAVYALADAISDMDDNLYNKMTSALGSVGLNVDGREFARLVRNVRTA